MSYKIGARRAQDIVSGEFDKDRINAEAVTQHEDALEAVLELGDLQVSDVDLGSNVIFLDLDPSDDKHASRKKYVDDQDAVVQSAVDTEKSRAEAAEAGLQSDISAESSARASADTALQANIDTEKGRIDAILDSAATDSDTFAEVVALINSVDLDNDNALASAISTASTDRAAIRSEFAAADASEASARASADTTLQSNIDAEASTARAAESANASAISSEASTARAAESANATAISDEESARVAAVSAEASARAAADTTLQGNIDSEASSRASADTTLQGNIDTLSATVSSNKSALEAADTTLQSNIDAEASARASADTTLQSNIDTEKARLDVLEGDSSVSGSVAKAIADVIDSAPEALNTLKELSSALGDDSDFASSMTTLVSNEETARIAADSSASSDRATIRSEYAAADTAIQSDLDTFKARTDNPHSVTPAQLGLVIGTDCQAQDATLQVLSDAYHPDDGQYYPVYNGDSYSGADGEANSVSYQRVGRYTSAPIVEPVQENYFYGNLSLYNFMHKYQMFRTDGISSGTTAVDFTLPTISTDYSTGDLGKMMVLKCDALENAGSEAVTVTVKPGGSGATANIDGGSSFTLDDGYSALTLVATSAGWRIV
jgi:hypothetical protein